MIVKISDVGVGVNVDSGKVEGSDEVRFDSDPERPVGGNTRPQQRASKSPEKRAPRPKLPVKFNRGQAPTPSQFYGQNQNNIPRQPPPVHTFRRMPTPTFPSSQESYVSQSSTLVAPAQKKSRMTLKPIAIKHFFYCMYLTIAMHARFQHYDLTIVL
ncbi:hypothetical protein V6N11_082388 [Hibiscus sabdariffa]|uniref:Uncharacterized protein n=2 Tax=Hibiscus sabdariffa TaxID=183260 RepID=A0ABR2PCE2_9ROSI